MTILMKTALVLLGAIALGVISGLANAATLTWTRNTESDMKDYAVYACFTKGCTVAQTATMLQAGFVLQPAVGTAPTYVMDLVGKEGSVAVSARDTTLNESGLSVQVPFDAKAPLVPGGLHFQ